MGAFYNSICLPGDVRREVAASLERWLALRGFERHEQPVMFDLDGETERSAFVLSNHRWTVLIFSKYEEERRLIRELQGWAETLLYVWVQDSDVWGFDLFDSAGFSGSFNSDPKTYRSFAEEEGDRPAADPEEVCRVLGVPGRAADLRRVERRRSAFQEDVCLSFCQLIEAEAALTGYDELERAELDHLEGWRVEQLLFVHRGSVPRDVRIDLHRHLLERRERDPKRDPTREIPAEVLAEAKQLRRRQRFRRLVLKPLSWLARAWRVAYAASYGALAPRRRPVRRAAPHHSSYIHEVRQLVNDRHGCRITLAEGAWPRLAPSKPASVFAFHVGDTSVTCTARRPWKIDEILHRPSRAKVMFDEKLTVAGLQIRHLLYQMPPSFLAGTSDPSFLALSVVRTARAPYVFLYRFARQVHKEIDRAIRQTVETFRLVGSEEKEAER